MKFRKKDNWVIFDIPYERPEEMISVMELKLAGEPEVDPALAIDPHNTLVLSTHFAEAVNCNKAKKSWMEKFGEWKHIMQVDNWEKEGSVSWDIDVFEPGYYMVKLKYSGTERSVWRVTLDGDAFIQNQQNASHVYHAYEIGWLKINEAGKHSISISLIEGDFEHTSLESMEIYKTG